ncbi:hypothetical protein GCM10022408_19760 [Hymenobacter fastidiosus]|uniref:Uncharacterized protein n=1 Tax=Hymenobacter fastidiosus TaxID=486264 RepID=A0ABP7S7B6_9BACT
MPREFKNPFGKTCLPTGYDTARNWVYNSRQGLLSTDAVIQGGPGVLTLSEAPHWHYMLNNNRG